MLRKAKGDLRLVDNRLSKIQFPGRFFFFLFHIPLKGNQQSSALGQTDYKNKNYITVSSLINYQGF